VICVATVGPRVAGFPDELSPGLFSPPPTGRFRLQLCAPLRINTANVAAAAATPRFISLAHLVGHRTLRTPQARRIVDGQACPHLIPLCDKIRPNS